MKKTSNPNINTFLQCFFGETNEISMERVKLKNWINYLTEDEPHPTVLPRFFNGRITWYGITFSEQQFRNLSVEIKAFLGPTYSDFNGTRANLDPLDPVECKLLELTGGRVIKFTGTDIESIWNSLELMRQTWLMRPTLVYNTIKPIGRVLRDFYISIQVKNQKSAEENLCYLRDSGFLDGLNIVFLQVQLLAGFELWSQILALPNLSELLHVRRPLAVTQALLKAIYRKELPSFEISGDVAEAIHHFQISIFPQYSELFRTYSGMTDPDVLKILMFYAVGSIPPKPQLRDELLSVSVPDINREYLKLIASMLVNPVVTVTGNAINLAIDSFKLYDYDEAFQFALTAETSLQRTNILLECAYELQTLDSERIAIEAVGQLSNAEWNELFKARRYREYWQQFTGEPIPLIRNNDNETIPDNWLNWIRKINQNGSWHRALEIAQKGVIEWCFEDFLNKVNPKDFLQELQASRTEEGEHVLFNALPYLFTFFQQDPEWPRPSFTLMYQVFLELMVLSTQGGDNDMTLFNELVETLLSLGIDNQEYNEIIEYASDLLNNYVSPAKLDWLLDLFDLLIIYPCPSQNERLNLFHLLLSKLSQLIRRVEPRHWEVINLIASDLKQKEVLENFFGTYGINLIEINSIENNLLNLLNHKTIAVYTLTESVAKRVKEFIEKTYTGISVMTSSDKVGTERLKSMAKNADFFILAPFSAKHAATEFIIANRSKNLPLLWAKGKGSASILNALFGYLNNEV